MTVTGAVNIASALVDRKVPYGVGAPGPATIVHVTPSFIVSFGTLAVIVIVPPAAT